MKKKYAFTLHFYRVHPKKEESSSKIFEALKEFQVFGETYWKYRFFYYLDQKNIPKQIFAILSNENKDLLQKNELIPYFDIVKMLRAKDIFFGIFLYNANIKIEAKLNIQLFQYSMELVNKKDEHKRKLEEKRQEILRRSLIKGRPGYISTLTGQCCNTIFFLLIAILLYLAARKYLMENESIIPIFGRKF